MLRALLIAAFFFTMTPLLIAVQWLLDKLEPAGLGRHRRRLLSRCCAGLLRIRVRVVGEPVRDRAVLFVSNHVSWADILVIGSIAPVAFVAKTRGRAIGRWSASPRACSARCSSTARAASRPATPSARSSSG